MTVDVVHESSVDFQRTKGTYGGFVSMGTLDRPGTKVPVENSFK